MQALVKGEGSFKADDSCRRVSSLVRDAAELAEQSSHEKGH